MLFLDLKKLLFDGKKYYMSFKCKCKLAIYRLKNVMDVLCRSPYSMYFLIFYGFDEKF